MDGLRIATVSDIHLGPLRGRAHTERIVAAINRLDADLVAIVGDLVDGCVAELGAAAAPLRDLRSRHGSFFVTGNHEYYSGVEEWVEEVDRLGLRVLQNKRVEIQAPAWGARPGRRQRRDRRRARARRRPDFAAALGDRDPSRPVVLLAHQPVQAHEAAQYGVDLQLSGHTHGGQMVPFNLLVRLEQPVVTGLGEVDGTKVYVTNGAGFWGPPVRVGAPPQITLVELRVVIAAPSRPRVAAGARRHGARDRMRRASVQRRTPRWPPALRRGPAHPLEVLAGVQPRPHAAEPRPGGPGARASPCSAPATSPIPPGTTTCGRRCARPSRGCTGSTRSAERDIARRLPPRLAGRRTRPVRFMLSVEISTIYKRDDRTRKVHHLIYLPDLDAVARFNTALGRIGNLGSDGRPILGLDSRDLLEITLEASPDGYLVPAHIWTPWFSALGSKSGFDAIADCYADLAEHIFAVETGLSSDPAMNWRVGSLDRLPAGVQLRRALPAGAGPRGDRARHRAGLLRRPRRAADRRRSRRHDRVLPRGGQVPRATGTGPAA